jgi:hypothetical protein
MTVIMSMLQIPDKLEDIENAIFRSNLEPKLTILREQLQTEESTTHKGSSNGETP